MHGKYACYQANIEGVADMAMKKPTRSIESDAAKAFIQAAVSVDLASGRRTGRRRPGPTGKNLTSITLLLPKTMLADIDAQIGDTATPRLVWIRMAIDSTLQAAQANAARRNVMIPEGCALLRKTVEF